MNTTHSPTPSRYGEATTALAPSQKVPPILLLPSGPAASRPPLVSPSSRDARERTALRSSHSIVAIAMQ